MREAPRPGRLEQLGLALLTGGAAVSTVPWGWAVLPVSLASLAWRVRRTSTRTLSAATIVVRLVLGAVALTAASFSIYPVLDDAQIARIGDVFGLVLLPLALVALFATPVVPPQAAALPLGLALLVVGLFDPGPTWASARRFRPSASSSSSSPRARASAPGSSAAAWHASR
jgi:hypothetical protein